MMSGAIGSAARSDREGWEFEALLISLRRYAGSINLAVKTVSW